MNNPKTAEEKAKELCLKLYHCYTPKAHEAKIILLALKEQDRDTRHACAEAVLQIGKNCNCVQCGRLRDQAHAACMNASAV
jgi:hypothetical protein